MKVRHTIIPAVFLVLRRGDEILLQRRQNTGHGDGKLSLVGGHVDQNEPSLTTLCREAKEEIGITINKKTTKFIYLLHRKQDDEERIDIFFEVKKWRGDIKTCEPDKCSELTFYPTNQIPADTLPYIRQALVDISSGTSYGEYGWK